MYMKVYRNASQAPNVIEVIGMPAVGKSTLCQKLVRENPSLIDANALLPHNHFLRQLYKLAAMLILLVEKPCLFQKSIIIILKSKQNSCIDFIKVCSNWFLMCRMMNVAHKEIGKTFLFDQGVFQGIWSILFSCKHPEVVLELLNNADCPSMVVLMDETNDVLKEREAGRQKSIRLEYNNQLQVTKARNALEMIVSYLNEKYEVTESNKWMTGNDRPIRMEQSS